MPEVTQEQLPVSAAPIATDTSGLPIAPEVQPAGEPTTAEPALAASAESSSTSITSTPAESASEASNGSASNADGQPESVMQPSAPIAALDVGTSSIAASSVDEPLHSRIAQHLEAIYELAKQHVETPATTVTQAASDLKAHASDILHKLHNGIAVSEGELVQKLEKLVSML